MKMEREQRFRLRFSSFVGIVGVSHKHLNAYLTSAWPQTLCGRKKRKRDGGSPRNNSWYIKILHDHPAPDSNTSTKPPNTVWHKRLSASSTITQLPTKTHFVSISAPIRLTFFELFGKLLPKLTHPLKFLSDVSISEKVAYWQNKSRSLF